MPIKAIAKADLKSFFEGLRDKLIKTGGRDGKGGRGEVAGKAFTYSRAVFNFAVDQSYIPSNPMNGLVRPVPTEPEQKSTRPLRADELRAEIEAIAMVGS